MRFETPGNYAVAVLSHMGMKFGPAFEADDTEDRKIALEEIVAEYCPTSYVRGLEIGTMDARVRGLKGNQFDWGAWNQQKYELVNVACEYSDAEGDWSDNAREFGIAAGRLEPLERFEVQGVRI